MLDTITSRRDAALVHAVTKDVVREITGHVPIATFNNRGRKYRTIKMVMDHLSDVELRDVSETLTVLYGKRFVNIVNGIADSRLPYPKVTAKFYL